MSERRDIVYMIVFLVTSVLLSAFGLFGGFSGGFTVSAILSTGAMSFYLLEKGYKFKLFSTLCLILSFVILANFIITSNGAVRFWSVVVYLCLTFSWFVSIMQTQSNHSELGFLQAIFLSIGGMFTQIPAMFYLLFVRNGKDNNVLGKVLLGFVLAFPVMIIVLPLLASSDEAFSGMIGLVLENTVTIIIKIIFGIGIAIFVISYGLSLKKNGIKECRDINLSFVEPTIIISFLSVISVCYLSYLFSQLAYFFEAFRGFLPEGYKFTVSAYARRGFFEMSAIAAINLVIILLCRLFVKKNHKKSNSLVNVLSTFIGVFTITIISTALSKMFLYIKSYGMTRLRITTSMFMFFLAIVFITLMIRLYTKKVNVVKTAFVAAGVVLILLGTVNVNSVVAKYNYTAYKDGRLKEIDVETISELGDEGIPYLIKLIKEGNSTSSDKAKYYLAMAYDNYYNFDYDENNNLIIESKAYDEIGQYRIFRHRAYKQLDQYLEENPDILEYDME